MTEYLLPLIKWLLVIVLSILLVGVIYEQLVRLKIECTAFKGKTFVEINGKSIHYVKKGNGDFTIVFQSGMGSSHAIWKEVQDGLSQQAVTISYDRSGLMLSDSSPSPVTNEAISQELQMLLEKTGCPKPYILVGHSMAGIYLRPFIKRNQKDILGILFVEASHPLQLKKASPELLKTLSIPPTWLIKLAIHTGLYRILYYFVPISPEIPFGHPLHILERDFFYRSYSRTLEEVEHNKMNFKDAEQYHDFGNIPLTVVMGTSPKRYDGIKNLKIRAEYQALLNEMQHDLLNLSSKSKLVKAPNSGHIIQIDDAKLLIDEIILQTKHQVSHSSKGI